MTEQVERADVAVLVAEAFEAGRTHPAPGLQETADVWFDTGREPMVVWSDDGRVFWLADPGNPEAHLRLWQQPSPPADPSHLGRVLAEGLAACDFPPTGDGAAPGHVRAALRAAGVVVPDG